MIQCDPFNIGGMIRKCKANYKTLNVLNIKQ